MKPNSLQNETETVEKPEIAIAFTSLLAAVAAKRLSSNPEKRAKTNVSRQSSNSSRRKRTAKGPRGIQAHGIREVWRAILHHQQGRQDCRDISLRGMAEDRGKAFASFELQSGKEEFLETDQLLRPASGDRWPGSVADSADS